MTNVGDWAGGAILQHPRLSHDGRRIAVTVVGATADIWLYDIERDSPTKLTGEGTNNRFPIWGPDETSVTFRRGSFGFYRKPADGSGGEEPVLEKFGTLTPGSWSSDGTTLVFYENTNTDAGRDLWSLGPDGERSVFLATEFHEWAPRLSPDDRWLAYVSDQTDEDRVYVRPFPDGGAVTAISTGIGTEPVWSHDGTELFFRDGDRMMVVEVVDVEAGTPFSAGRPRVLFEESYQADPDGIGNPNFDVASDGRFLMIKTDALDAPLRRSTWS